MTASPPAPPQLAELALEPGDFPRRETNGWKWPAFMLAYLIKVH